MEMNESESYEPPYYIMQKATINHLKTTSR